MTDRERLRQFAQRVYDEMPCACGPIEEAGVCACPIAEAGEIIGDNPPDHNSTPNGCEDGCPACELEFKHSAGLA